MAATRAGGSALRTGSGFPRTLGLLRNAGLRAADVLLPPRCLACGAIAPRDGALCGACWGGLSFIERPFCACCGLPFEFHIAEGALCGGCAAGAPAFEAARAVLRYDEASRPLILSFKHGDRMQAGRHFGGWMARAGGELTQQADLVAPVPLHWRRLAARRYNQSAELARGVAAAAGIGLCVDLLRRVRATPSQGRSQPPGPAPQCPRRLCGCAAAAGSSPGFPYPAGRRRADDRRHARIRGPRAQAGRRRPGRCAGAGAGRPRRSAGVTAIGGSAAGPS